MFHGTNFTESSTSYETIDRLMNTADSMYEFIRETPTEREQHTQMLNFANEIYMRRRRLTLEDMPEEGFRDQEHMALWTIHANRVHWSARWGELAFPRVQMSHSYAAQLMATTVSKQEIPFIQAPWPAFLLEVPDGLLPLTLKDNTTTYITRIHVNSSFLSSFWHDAPWWGLELTGKGVEIHRVGRIAEAFDPATKRDLKGTPLLKLPDSYGLEEKDQPVGDGDEDYEDFWACYNQSEEDRVSILAARLVLGACIMMTDKSNYKEKVVRINPGLASLRRRGSKEPISRVYVVGQPVKVDFRMAVREYLKGTLRSLTVQSLVAGHHKSQPHGPASSLRKWIFVKPYWRGPEDGPVLVRPHTVDP
jgi:hypothetical protein